MINFFFALFLTLGAIAGGECMTPAPKDDIAKRVNRLMLFVIAIVCFAISFIFCILQHRDDMTEPENSSCMPLWAISVCTS